MALKDIVTHRPTRVALKWAVVALVALLIDFGVWYIADTTTSKYENVAFTLVFLFIFFSACRRVLSGKVLTDVTPPHVFFGTTLGISVVSLIIAFFCVIPILVLPNWFGLMGMIFILSLIGLAARRRMERKGQQ